MTVTLVSGRTRVESYPIGMVMAWHNTSPPKGWLVCNGGNVPIASYRQLYNVLTTNGTRFPYGPNVGANFVVPNMTSRFPRTPTYTGVGIIYTEGATAGATTHTHTWNFTGMTVSASGNSTHQHTFSQNTDSPAEGGVHSLNASQGTGTNSGGVNVGANGAQTTAFLSHNHNVPNVGGNSDGHGGHAHNNNAIPASAGTHAHNYTVSGGSYTPTAISHLQTHLQATYIILALPEEKWVQ